MYKYNGKKNPSHTCPDGDGELHEKSVAKLLANPFCDFGERRIWKELAQRWW